MNRELTSFKFFGKIPAESISVAQYTWWKLHEGYFLGIEDRPGTYYLLCISYLSKNVALVLLIVTYMH